MRIVKAEKLEPGMVLALPFGKTATITEIKIGRQFVGVKTEEYGPSRVEIGSEHLIETKEHN